MQGKLQQLVDTIARDPAVDTVVGFTGGSRAGGGFLFVNLKPAGQRDVSGQQVINRLRPQLARISGVTLFLNTVQDLRMGGRSSNSTYQYTLKSDNIADLKRWAGRLADALKRQSALTDIDTDQSDAGVEAYVDVDRDRAASLGLTARSIDNALYDAFGQRQAATLYDELNQYRVILEAAPAYTRGTPALADVQVPGSGTTAAGTTATAGSGTSTLATTASTSTTQSTPTTAASTSGSTGASAGANTSGAAAASANPGLRDAAAGQGLSTSVSPMVPLPTIARITERSAPTSINHQDAELATTVSFNLAPGSTLSDAQAAVRAAEAEIGMPRNVAGSFQGQARQFQQSQGQQPLLILAALVVIYLVLGVLYESLVHPLTVLSTLPSAGVGAVLALLMFNMEFSIMALIGLFLLIGIVKKNAILIIDFALEAERSRGLTPLQAVREACLLRFRPILMTTLAAALGVLPLAIGFGEGAELRRPLGIAIIGGLVASQLLTLLTTPVVYLLLDKLRRRGADERLLAHMASGGAA
jgi:multidrug efflux pump